MVIDCTVPHMRPGPRVHPSLLSYLLYCLCSTLILSGSREQTFTIPSVQDFPFFMLLSSRQGFVRLDDCVHGTYL